jgi:hypothetical protein
MSRHRGRPEEHVDRGPVAVLARADRQPCVAVFDYEVVIGRRYEDLTGAQRLAVGSSATRKRASPLEDPSERAGASGRDVQNDADSGREIGGQPRHNPSERLDATGGCADNDKISLVSELLEDVG